MQQGKRYSSDQPRPARARISAGRTIAAIAALGAVVLIIVVSLPHHHALVIYSSLAQRQQQQPLEPAGSSALPVVANGLTRDMEDAIRLALKQADGKAGDLDVTYKPLDDSDATGESPTALVQANARQAAKDENTAVYIGDLTSGATQASLPILSDAKIPQISMTSTRIGLTTRDTRGDVDEPDRYYPRQPGYPDGYRNFVRIIPRDDVQAKALLAVMTRQDSCGRAAMINDNSSYGEALANNILAQNHHRVRFVFSQAVGPRAYYGHLVQRVEAMKVKPDCVVYCGTRNPNTVAIIEAFARALPGAKLYGTDGLAAASFFDAAKHGVSPAYAPAIKVMIPPYDVQQARRLFFRPFKDAYKRDADPQAVYAYEAMRVVLKAIADSATGKRKDILAKLLSTTRDRAESTLGPYSIDGATGDTDVKRYGVSRIKDGKLTSPKIVSTSGEQ
jgi:branched-chain amino acid transport system substrate-binding protein